MNRKNQFYFIYRITSILHSSKAGKTCGFKQWLASCWCRRGRFVTLTVEGELQVVNLKPGIRLEATLRFSSFPSELRLRSNRASDLFFYFSETLWCPMGHGEPGALLHSLQIRCSLFGCRSVWLENERRQSLSGSHCCGHGIGIDCKSGLREAKKNKQNKFHLAAATSCWLRPRMTQSIVSTGSHDERRPIINPLHLGMGDCYLGAEVLDFTNSSETLVMFIVGTLLSWDTKCK